MGSDPLFDEEHAKKCGDLNLVEMRRIWREVEKVGCLILRQRLKLWCVVKMREFMDMVIQIGVAGMPHPLTSITAVSL